MGQDVATAAHVAARIYTKPILRIYDLAVYGFSNAVVWKCPTPRFVEFYSLHVSGNHLEVGVGTGYVLDRCRFPTPNPTLVLSDLNVNTLHTTARRVARYHPRPCLANVLAPLPFAAARFDSIGINYVLHCLPGTMVSKGVVVQNLKPLLTEDGVLFGATVLGQGVRRGLLARVFMQVYNAIKAFSNTSDDVASLEQILGQAFREYRVQVVGCVAFFEARP